MAATDGDRFDGYFRELLSTAPHGGLTVTPAELANLKWLSHGLRITEIACVRSVSAETVKKQLADMRRRLAAKTNEQAVAIALRHGLIS